MNASICVAAWLALGLASAPALAETATTGNSLTEFLKGTSFSGTLRAYDFNRVYSDKTQSAQPSQSAFSLGGILNVQTAPFLGGFSVGASFFTAHSLGANDRNDGLIHVDQTLAGGRTSITALGQAFLQYKNSWLLVRAGDQLLNTPWLPDSDSRLLPATYQGFYAALTLTEELHLYGLRIFRWKSRTSTDYFQNNLYYSPTYAGDDLRGGIPGPSKTNITSDTQGVLAFGGAYSAHGLKTSLWYYNFEQFANLLYNDTTYTVKTGTGFDPFAGGQFVREWKSNSLLNGNLLYAVRGNGVNNRTYGLKGGVNSPYGQLLVSYTNIAFHEGAIGNGALISPYTVGYTTDPLDTSSIIRGEVDQGPGHAYKVRYGNKFFGDTIGVATSFARYYSNALGNSNDAYFDITWFPGGTFKGVSIRNRFEDAVASTPSLGLNPGKSKYFIYDRVQLQYEF